MELEDERDYTLVATEMPSRLAFKKVEYTDLYCKVEYKKLYNFKHDNYIMWDHITLSVPGYELTNKGPVRNG